MFYQGELDARIVELEEKIRFGSIPLREEKMVVNDISKLRGQREKIKEYELHKASLGELEAEAKKVKAVIEEMDGEGRILLLVQQHHARTQAEFFNIPFHSTGEFSIIKGERDAASGIIKDFWTQLKAAEAEAAKVEYEQKEAVDKKNEALEALDAARREVDGSMVDYRDNRKFSLQVRPLFLISMDMHIVWNHGSDLQGLYILPLRCALAHFLNCALSRSAISYLQGS